MIYPLRCGRLPFCSRRVRLSTAETSSGEASVCVCLLRDLPLLYFFLLHGPRFVAEAFRAIAMAPEATEEVAVSIYAKLDLCTGASVCIPCSAFLTLLSCASFVAGAFPPPDCLAFGGVVERGPAARLGVYGAETGRRSGCGVGGEQRRGRGARGARLLRGKVRATLSATSFLFL